MATVIQPEQIKALRASLGMGQAQLADVLDVHVQTIKRWERGERGLDHLRAEGVLVALHRARGYAGGWPPVSPRQRRGSKSARRSRIKP